MSVTVKKIATDDKNENIVYWSVEEDDWKFVVEVDYVDIYSAGYVYNITAYCPQSNMKMEFLRVKSYRSLLEDEKAAINYFSDDFDLCANMADFGFSRKKMTKKDCQKVEKILEK